MTVGTAHHSMECLVEELFQPTAVAYPDGSLGAELELIPVRPVNHRRVGIDDAASGPGSASAVREAARANGWTEQTDAYGAPDWVTPEGGRIGYEPGGQIEISSPVFQSAEGLALFLGRTVTALRQSAAPADIELLTLGIDPYNAIEDVATELHAPRYDDMVRHFNSIGPSGARMMRQTASLQLNVELGPDPLARWSLLNALAPYLTAKFANSRCYANSDTGFASYRARLWQALDASRTGIPFNASDPIGAYALFARRAARIMSDDRLHLSTLFPEVRPRGYFELRSMDAMEPARADEAIRFVAALIHDADVAAEAARVLGSPDVNLLARAAISGRSDRQLDDRLRVLESIAAGA